MIRASATLAVVSVALPLPAQTPEPKPAIKIPYDVAREHEIKPHRRSIPTEGVTEGFNQLHLNLTVSPSGDVTDAKAEGEDKLLEHWPALQGEVGQWRFSPFEQGGHATTAQIEEYLDLVPPENLPKTHVPPPTVGPGSSIKITLEHSGCMGSCPAYSVTLSTSDGIVFNGQSFVVASGHHTARFDPDAVRKLAKEFVAADFYSMAPGYEAGVTDCPTYQLSITIDGRHAAVVDYMGQWVGMPAVIADLEDQVDDVTGTKRWIEGSEGLVAAVAAEKFKFDSFEAQQMVRLAAIRGESATVMEFLEAGVSLNPIPPPASAENTFPPRVAAGWLTAASSHADTLRALIQAGASKKDQSDKDMALLGAARTGDLTAVRALIAYGANPKANLTHAPNKSVDGMSSFGDNPGSALISAAASGNPDVVREILSHHPNLEARARDGKTAIFAAAEYEGDAEDEARVQCVRLLVEAGANVNARDKDGNTALHETFLTPVEEELLKLGADVNARNNDGETPIFTTVDTAAIALCAAHGAKLSLRNKDGKTALEASQNRGVDMQNALIAAMQQ